jgi:hypothetical protein
VNSADPESKALIRQQRWRSFPVRDFAGYGSRCSGAGFIVSRPQLPRRLSPRRNQVFGLFWRTRIGRLWRAGTHQGYQWIDWRNDRLEFCAVSTPLI